MCTRHTRVRVRLLRRPCRRIVCRRIPPLLLLLLLPLPLLHLLPRSVLSRALRLGANEGRRRTSGKQEVRSKK